MDFGRVDRIGGHGRTANPCPIRVTIDSKHQQADAIRIRFRREVLKRARWQLGDLIRPQIDPGTGEVTIARDPRGWKLTDATGNKNSKGGAATVRIGMTDEAKDVIAKFLTPADITDFIEDGGVIVFQLARR